MYFSELAGKQKYPEELIFLLVVIAEWGRVSVNKLAKVVKKIEKRLMG